tara:strand:+ start:2992 stop:3447 length:456 start_codon:yes stop_codon:yes gene_type:complete
LFGLLSATPMAGWGQKLPPASRTVYKCEQQGRVVYSDTPCLGAQKLDIEPTRGLDASSGRARTGADVQREKQRELVAEAVRPLSGMNSREFDRAARRTQLPAASQRACGALDESIPRLERREQQAAEGPSRQAVQRELLTARAAFRHHRCD